jgi:hypothetical protein
LESLAGAAVADLVARFEAEEFDDSDVPSFVVEASNKEIVECFVASSSVARKVFNGLTDVNALDAEDVRCAMSSFRGKTYKRALRFSRLSKR